MRVLLLSALSSSAAIAVVLVLRKPLRSYFGARAGYLLWALVPFAELVLLLPAPALTVPVRVFPLAQLLPAAVMAPIFVVANSFDPTAWLTALWLIGGGISVLVLVARQRRFVRALGELSEIGERTLRAQATTGCPALLGAWSPRIVLPADFDLRYNETERALVLAHERAHSARGDAQVNLFVAVQRCIFWFNPLIHFAASRFRFDQELACDAVVIARFPETRRLYADAMLKAQLAGESWQEPGLPVGCHWQSTHPLRERIAMLKQPLPGPARTALGAGIAVAIILAGTLAAWAAQPATPQTEPKAASADSPPTEDVAFRQMHPPEYPAAAIAAHQEGELTFKVFVDEHGAPQTVAVETSKPPEAEQVFAPTAIDAIKQWRFNPAVKHGKPSAGFVSIPITYALSSD